MPPVILITRPAPECAATADVLGRLTGLRVIQSPLLAIRAMGALPDMTEVETLIFTSRNAVRRYAALNGPNLPAICVGTATAAVAREMGHQTRTMGGDAAALIKDVIADPPVGPMLHIRGEVAQCEIARHLTAAGLPTDEVVVYAQDFLDLSKGATAALVGQAPVIVPLYSPRTARRFALLCPKDAPVHIVSISRSTQDALNLANEGFNAISTSISATPDAAAMIQAITATLQRLEGR